MAGHCIKCITLFRMYYSILSCVAGMFSNIVRCVSSLSKSKHNKFLTPAVAMATALI